MTAQPLHRNLDPLGVGQVSWSPDYRARQTALFDAKATLPKKCECGVERKNLCPHSADIAHQLIPASTPRPKTCLDRYDPADGEVPY